MIEPIPIEFFDWWIAQWWGPGSFVAIVLVALIGFSAGLAGATSR